MNALPVALSLLALTVGCRLTGGGRNESSFTAELKRSPVRRENCSRNGTSMDSPSRIARILIVVTVAFAAAACGHSPGATSIASYEQRINGLDRDLRETILESASPGSSPTSWSASKALAAAEAAEDAAAAAATIQPPDRYAVGHMHLIAYYREVARFLKLDAARLGTGADVEEDEADSYTRIIELGAKLVDELPFLTTLAPPAPPAA